MGLKKGQTNNTKGRPKGTPNKITQEVRSVIRNITTEYFNSDQFIHDFSMLEPKDRIQAMEKLLKYHIPTLTSVDANVITNKKIDDEAGNMTDEQFFELIDKVKEFKNQ